MTPEKAIRVGVGLFFKKNLALGLVIPVAVIRLNVGDLHAVDFP